MTPAENSRDRVASHNAALLRRAEKFRKANEARHDQTLQRQFELRFLSRDLPDSKAARADASDGCRTLSQMIARLDAPYMAKWRFEVIRRTASHLPLPTRRDELSLGKLLWAIYRNKTRKKDSIRELNISLNTYNRGVVKIFKMLPRLVKMGVCGTSPDEQVEK